jgi:hypothetical protein
MSNLRALCAAGLLASAVVACSEEPTTSVRPAEVDTPADLTFTFPAVTNGTLIHSEVEVVPAPSAPTAVLYEEDPSSPEDPPPPPLPSKIISSSTTVGFLDGTIAYSSARQLYTGNHGRISTTATVSYSGTVIGTQPASREVTGPYLLDGGREKTLWVEAYVHTDQTCGLRVKGDSLHQASWQWFLGPVSNFGEDSETSYSFPPVDQPPCEETIEPYGPGGGGVEGGGAEGNEVVTCWYLVTIDYQTGEIIDAQFLYCDGLEEGG